MKSGLDMYSHDVLVRNLIDSLELTDAQGDLLRSTLLRSVLDSEWVVIPGDDDQLIVYQQIQQAMEDMLVDDWCGIISSIITRRIADRERFGDRISTYNRGDIIRGNIIPYREGIVFIYGFYAGSITEIQRKVIRLIQNEEGFQLIWRIADILSTLRDTVLHDNSPDGLAGDILPWLHFTNDRRLGKWLGYR